MKRVFFAVIAVLSLFVLVVAEMSLWNSVFGSNSASHSSPSSATRVIVTFASPALSADARYAQMSRELKVSMRTANIRAARGESVNVPDVKSVDEMVARDPELSAKLSALEREHREFERALPNGWKIATIMRENGRSQLSESYILVNTVTGKKYNKYNKNST